MKSLPTINKLIFAAIDRIENEACRNCPHHVAHTSYDSIFCLNNQEKVPCYHNNAIHCLAKGLTFPWETDLQAYVEGKSSH